MSILRPLIRYADFQGRASRGEYFGFLIAQYLVGGMMLTAMILAMRAQDARTGAAVMLGFLAVGGLMALGLLIPNYAVLVRRLHDSGRSAWWLMLLAPNVAALFMVAGGLGGVVQHAMQGADARVAVPAFLASLAGAGVMMLAAQVCGFILFILTLLPGEAGDNRFGPDPRFLTPVGRDAGGLAQDEARLERLFEEARQGLAQPAAASPRDMAPARAAGWDRPAYDPGIAPSRPFGKRV